MAIDAHIATAEKIVASVVQNTYDDLQTSERVVENVVGNYWSLGGTFVIR